MNRLQLAEHEIGLPTAQPPRVEQSLVQTSGPADVSHTIFIPLHYEKNYAYPLLVWLHGQYDDERQLQRVMPLISMRNYVAVAPRGSCAIEGESSRFRWQQSEQSVATAQQNVFDCIEQVQEKYNISRRRIFVAGYQDGGTMAFRIALQRPEMFDGALSIGGPFPCGNAPLANLERVRSLPLFIAHGRDARSYSIQQACRELRLFHAAGLCVTLRQYPCGDELTTQMLHDMNVWLMEQVTGQTPSADNDDVLPPGDLN